MVPRAINARFGEFSTLSAANSPTTHHPPRTTHHAPLTSSIVSPVLPPAAVAAEKACSPDLPTIGELAATTPDLSTLLAAVQAVNLTDVLSLPGPVDVFAPTNDAFAALLSSFDITAEQLLAETDLVTRVLQLHVVTDGAVCAGDLSGTVPTALAGERLAVADGVVTAGGSSANVVGAVAAGNGVVYLIDAVLLPTPTVDSAAPGVEGPSAEGPSAEGPSAEDVFNLLDGNGDGFVTEDELRDAAEKGGIALTDEQVAAFMAADADGDGVEIDEFLNSLDESVTGLGITRDWLWGLTRNPYW